MIQTSRLLLREIVLQDLRDIHLLLSLPETDRYNALGIPESISMTSGWVEEWMSSQSITPRTSFTYCLTDKDTMEFIGLIALVSGKPNYRIAEVWFKILPRFWNKGYTTEALVELLRFGFMNLGLHRIEAGCALENIASATVLEKAGMVREGTKRKLIPKDGAWMDAYMYALLEEDFIKRNLPPAV